MNIDLSEYNNFIKNGKFEIPGNVCLDKYLDFIYKIVINLKDKELNIEYSKFQEIEKLIKSSILNQCIDLGHLPCTEHHENIFNMSNDDEIKLMKS